MNNDSALSECLNAAGLVCLPQRMGDMPKRWLKAIAKVQTYAGISYAIVANNGLKPVIRQTFGRSSAILGILELYPYEYFSTKMDFPHLKTNDEIICYLLNFGHKEEDIRPLLSTDGKTPEQIVSDRGKVYDFIRVAAYGVAEEKNDDDHKEIAKYEESRELAERAAKGEKIKTRKPARRKQQGCKMGKTDARRTTQK